MGNHGVWLGGVVLLPVCLLVGCGGSSTSTGQASPLSFSGDASSAKVHAKSAPRLPELGNSLARLFGQETPTLPSPAPERKEIGAATNSPRFRGANGSGTFEAKDLPTQWSATSNIVWKTDLPGPGASSPITFGERIYLTCYSGYGIDRNSPGEMSKLKRHLVCLDRATGKITWDTAVASRRPQQGYSGFIALHGYASGSPVCDGERVYAFFGASGVYAFDLQGKQVWDAEVGNRSHGFGTGTSVILYKGLLIVNAFVESGKLIALDKKTGREVWSAEEVNEAWGTPILVEAGDRTELVVDTKDTLRGLDPDSGKLLWKCAGSQPPRYVCPSPIFADGVIYAVHGYSGPLSAVRPGGNGDVTESHRLWKRPRVGSTVPSPVHVNGHVFVVQADGGVVFCINAKNGEIVYQERLRPEPGNVYASLTAADGKIYVVSRERGTYVLSAEPSFKLLAHNTIKTDNSIFNGSIVVTGKRLLLRSDEALYCIGKTEE